MTDKFRRTHPLNITFAEGEQPSSAKLTAVASQARVGARLLEKAVGDLWNQSGDSILSEWPLQIPNLARVIGENKWLNPVLYPVAEQFTYHDNLGTKFTNQNHCYLQFAPATVNSVVAATGSVNLTNKVASEYLVVAAGDWWVDGDTGRFRSFTALSTVDALEYTVNSSEWAVTDATVPCVVPDPRQENFTACRISTDGVNFFVHLPPRMPLSALEGFDLPERYPPQADWDDNQATTAASYKLWQSESVNALEDAHYRYPLPQELAQIIDDLEDGADLPEGFMYLWDQSTNTIVEDATFQKSDEGNWIFIVSAPSRDLASTVSESEAEISYNSTNYSIIFAGSPISRVLNTLSKVLQAGTHNNSGDFTPVLSHSVLSGQNPPNSDYTSHASRYPTTVPSWSPSRWAFDDHVSLLSRAGSQGTAGGRNRDVNDNAMLGSLVMASTAASGGNYLNITSASNRIYFGSVAAGPSLYGHGSSLKRINLDGQIVVTASDTNSNAITGTGTGTGAGGIFASGSTASANGIEVTGLGSSGYVGKFASSVAAYCLRLEADAGSGTNGMSIVLGDSTGVYGIELLQLPAFAIGIAISSGGAGNDKGIEITSVPTGMSISGATTGISVSGTTAISASATGTAISATSSAGRAAIIQGDTSSPALAALRIVPQDAQPNGASLVGDMYVTSAGVLKICTAAGTPGTWVSVGAQT